MSTQSINQAPAPQISPAPEPGPAFTSSIRAIKSIDKNLANLDGVRDSKDKIAKARDGDEFMSRLAEYDTQRTNPNEEAKKSKRSTEQAAQKLEQALNNLNPVAYQFAFGVIEYKFPELFSKYTKANQESTLGQNLDANNNAGIQSQYKQAYVISRAENLAPLVKQLVEAKKKEDLEKPESERMSAEEKSGLETMLGFFSEDGGQVKIDALVSYYKDNFQDLPKDIRMLFDKRLQKSIANANEARVIFENASKNTVPEDSLPKEYVGNRGERAWLNRLTEASKKTGEYYNYTDSEALATFNPLPWQPEFAVSYPVVTLVRGYRPGFEDSSNKYQMTSTQGYVNQALTPEVPSPRFIMLEGLG